LASRVTGGGKEKGASAPSFNSHCPYSFGGETPIRVSNILFSVCSNKGLRQPPTDVPQNEQ
jgi:hypothetical protein